MMYIQTSKGNINGTERQKKEKINMYIPMGKNCNAYK